MSRLLFAAARGARIQVRVGADPKWLRAYAIRLVPDVTLEYRIHPDDAHLQYGPISSALHKIAQEDTSVLSDEAFQAAYGMADAINYGWQSQYRDELHRSMFLLILAEALADEGM